VVRIDEEQIISPVEDIFDQYIKRSDIQGSYCAPWAHARSAVLQTFMGMSSSQRIYIDHTWL